MKPMAGHNSRTCLCSNLTVQHIIADWMPLVLSMKAYPIVEGFDDIRCETLVAGKNCNGKLPPDDDGFDEFYVRYVASRTKLMNLVDPESFNERTPNDAI